MGLIKAASGAAGGVLADQWKEYFYCEALPADTLAVKGRKKVTKRSSNTKGDENIITTGSVIAVADGQCMLIVDQGKVAEVCAEPGEFVYDASTEPSIFAGSLGESIGRVFRNIGRRFTFGGEAPKDQRVYYFNTKEILDNKYGTASPVPFRVVDQRAGIDMDVGIKCFGTYSYKITNPLLFYTNVCGNVSEDYKRSQLDSQLKAELLTALQPAFAKISELGIRYSALPGHAMELADARTAAFMDPTRAAAHLVTSQGDAMKMAAANQNAGPAMAFMGMNMAGQAGGANVQNLFQMGQQQAAQAPAQPQAATSAAGSWKCACGAENSGKFCVECGKPRPEAAWKCPQCGTENKGKFCSECGAQKPLGVYQCNKCGWKPADPAHPPKFCPECGDPFNEMDLK